MALGSMKKSSSGGGDNKPTENPVVRIKSFEGVEAAGRANSNDYFVAELMADHLGMSKGDEVKVYLRERKQEGKFPRREIGQLMKKKGQAPAVQEGGIVQLDRTYIDRNSGAAMANWINVMQADPESDAEYVFPNVLASVAPERKGKNSQKPYQNVTMLNAGAAKQFTTFEEFEEIGKQMLSAEGNGRRGFVVRGMSPEEGEAAALTCLRGQKKQGDEYVPEDPEEVFQKFLDSENGKGFKDAFENTQNGIWEVIPAISLPVGPLMLPSAEDNDKGRDMSRPFQKEGGKYSGFAWTNVGLKKSERPDGTDFWFVAHASPSHQRALVYEPDEVPSANMPDDFRQKVEANIRAAQDARYQKNADSAATNDDESDPDREAQAGMSPS